MQESNTRRKTLRRLVLAALVVSALFASAGLAKPDSSRSARQEHTVTCKGPASLAEFFKLAGGRKIKARGVSCAVARKAAKRFPAACVKAYTSQARCTLRAGKRWRCRSRIAGPLEKGAPSRVTCTSKRDRISFVMAFDYPAEPDVPSSPTAIRSDGPFDEQQGCVDTSNPGQVLPAPNSTGAGNFQIHLLGVPAAVGQQLQATLVAKEVTDTLNAGLAARPRGYPRPVPIFLVPDEFDKDGHPGVTYPTCSNPGVDGIVVRTNRSPARVASTAAHEIFHAYSIFGLAGAPQTVPWWEEASATWFALRLGFPEEDGFNINLQYPDRPLDLNEPKTTYKYAMSKFVQFMENHGLIADPAWWIQRDVVDGYPDATKALADSLLKEVPTPNPLGELLAEFWGSRLKAESDRLLPTPPKNATAVQVKLGKTTVPVTAERLHTKLLDITLGAKVVRVEFEFHPGQGYFWGLVGEDESRRFQEGESVSFCVGAGDQDDLKWPGHFHVTFTNGNLSGNLKGEIKVRASGDPEQCTGAAPNRACRLLKKANVDDLLGAGIYPFSSESADNHVHHWLCFYEGASGEARLDLARYDETAKQVRARARAQIRALGLDPIDIGDVAGIGMISAGDETTGIIVIAVAKEIAFLQVAPWQRQKLVTLAKRIAGELA
jgi:hypothetical protein